MKRFNSVKFIPEKIKATLLWRVYFVYAMQRPWKKLLVAVSLVSVFPVFMFGIASLNWPLPNISDMEKIEGTLVSVYKPSKPNGMASISVSNISGEVLKYRGNNFDKAETVKLKNNIGRPVTVRSHWYYDIAPPFYYRKYFQIKVDEQIVLDLGNSNYFSDVYNESERRLFGGFLFVVAASFFWVLCAYFRDAKKLKTLKGSE